MTVSQTLTDRNAGFATDGFEPGLRMMPSLRTIVIGCVDPRVDPTEVLGLRQGETAGIRNVGGRVTPATLQELVLLRQVSRSNGGDIGPGWEIVVLQHTDCGITRLEPQPGLLADYLGVDEAGLPGHAVSDPRAAVVHDVATLREHPDLAGVVVSGLVYDVATGRVETVA